MRDLEKEIQALDARLKPLASGPIDIHKPGWEKSPGPNDPRAQALLERIVPIYQRASAEDRERIRALFRTYDSFAWAASLPHKPTTQKKLLAHLLHFSIADQGQDSRDAILWLDAICAQASKVGLDLRPALKEAAALSSAQDRFGMGSTQAQLRRAH